MRRKDCQGKAPPPLALLRAVFLPLQLYILYTKDSRSQLEDRQFLKFADRTVVVSLLHKNDSRHELVVGDFEMKKETISDTISDIHERSWHQICRTL